MSQEKKDATRRNSSGTVREVSQEAIRALAYQLFCEGGCGHGARRRALDRGRTTGSLTASGQLRKSLADHRPLNHIRITPCRLMDESADRLGLV